MTILPAGLSSANGAQLRWPAYLLLLLLGLALFVPGLATLPPIDRDEPRYAQASKQMLTSGDYGDIYFQQEPRYKKPIGIYWLQSLSAGLFGDPPYDAIWPYRLPSLLAGLLALLLTAWGVASLAGARAGLLSALILATSPLLHFEARIAKTDAALLVCCIGAQLILARAYCGRAPLSAPLAYGFWLFQAAGILIKGPLAPFFSLLTIAVLALADRRAGWLRQLRPATGLPLCLALVLPWLLWIGFASHGEFYGESVAHDFLGKIFQGQDRGALPPGYHTLLLLACFLPQIMLALSGLWQGWRQRREPAPRFALAWIMPAWLVFELIFTKLPHYVLPCYPAIAWLAARHALAADPRGLPHGFLRAGLLLQTLAMITALLAMMAAALFLGAPALLALSSGAAGIGAALRQAQLFFDRPARAACYGLAAGGLLLTGVFSLVLPHSAPWWLTPQITQAWQTQRPCSFLGRLVTSGYNEPSLVFSAGTDTLFANGVDYAADSLAADACALALVRDRDEPAFHVALFMANTQATRLGSIRGFNYNGGGWQDYGLYRQRAWRGDDGHAAYTVFWPARPAPLTDMP